MFSGSSLDSEILEDELSKSDACRRLDEAESDPNFVGVNILSLYPLKRLGRLSGDVEDDEPAERELVYLVPNRDL